MPSPEDQAHVEHLVAVELAHRKETATLQAMVLELRGRLGEAERLIGRAAKDVDKLIQPSRFELDCAAYLKSREPPDSPPAALPCGCIAHPWGGSCPKPATPPEAAVAACPCFYCGGPTEFIGKGLYRCIAPVCRPATPPVSTVDSRVAALEARVAALETWRGALKDAPDGIQHEYVNDGKKRCEVCGVRQYAECHAVPGAAK